MKKQMKGQPQERKCVLVALLGGGTGGCTPKQHERNYQKGWKPERTTIDRFILLVRATLSDFHSTVLSIGQLSHTRLLILYAYSTLHMTTFPPGVLQMWRIVATVAVILHLQSFFKSTGYCT